MRRFTRIKELSERRRLPRAGKIRLGFKDTKGGRTFPRETAHFLVPPEVARVYGDKPTELDVLLPVEQEEITFPQAYEMYGSARGLFCTGDGETAMRWDEEARAMVERECPCALLDDGKCKRRGHLMVLLPLVDMGQVYQIDTSSYNSIVDVNSGIDFVRALIGRVAMVPLKLRREPTETQHERDGKQVKRTHYTLKLVYQGDSETINALRENTGRVISATSKLALPAPTRENPEAADVDTIDDGAAAERWPDELPQTVTLEQAETLKRMVAEKGADEPNFLRLAGAEDYTKIHADMYEGLIELLGSLKMVRATAKVPPEPSEAEKLEIGIGECDRSDQLPYWAKKLRTALDAKRITDQEHARLNELIASRKMHLREAEEKR